MTDTISNDQILQLDEIDAVITDLRARRRESNNYGTCLAVFRLCCFYGLRSCEVAGLNLFDIVPTGRTPTIKVRAAITKGENGKRRGRTIPLDLNGPAHRDLEHWHRVRRDQVDGDLSQPLVCCQNVPHVGRRSLPTGIRRRWRTALRALDEVRVRQLPSHSGRHTFASYCLAENIPPRRVLDWMGHRSLQVTDIYVHTVACLQGATPQIFQRPDQPEIMPQPAESSKIERALQDYWPLFGSSLSA